MKARRTIFSAHKIIAAGLLSVGCAANPAVFAQSDAVCAARSAEWWQWALSIPSSVNPLLDNKGDNCMVGQHGPVWFLGGHFGDSANPISRNCTVPANETIFFPISNSINIDTPNACDQDSSLTPVPILRARSADAISHITRLSVTLDGVPVSSLKRIQSTVFAVTLPEKSLFAPLCVGTKGGLPSGVYSRAVDDGYYVTLDSLQKGKHTLRFTVKNDSGQLIQNMTYYLRVM